MKEDFLHYLWKFKKFPTSNLQTTNHQSITIIYSGDYLQLAGPDFFNAQLNIGGQKWAGNVEIHLNASDWYLHHHEKDDSYDNVILHVVWHHNVDVYRKDNTAIPTLELKNIVGQETISKYESLILPKTWIYCENQITQVSGFVVRNWKERLFFERLERKAELIQVVLHQTQNDWEATLFCLLAKNFGLNTNGPVFYQIASAIPFSILRKESNAIESIEALLLGMAGLLRDEKEDVYFNNLQTRFHYLVTKYQLEIPLIAPVQFFRLRPDNFPTIRLSQLANLYGTHLNLFSQIIEANAVKQLYRIFQVPASPYWQSHYLFDHTSKAKAKSTTQSFIDLLIINTIIPVQFAYAKNRGKENIDGIITLLESIKSEQNSTVEKFRTIGIDAENAFESQSLLQLKNEYCNKGRCLECAIGIDLLKENK
ncbi:MAG: DUF2851 family protein [Flavobacterium sp.]|nr:DUF2851 family protein [Flavobacterium sp.]